VKVYGGAVQKFIASQRVSTSMILKYGIVGQRCPLLRVSEETKDSERLCVRSLSTNSGVLSNDNNFHFLMVRRKAMEVEAVNGKA